MKYYYNEKTKEEVYEDDWTNYAMKQLGITIKPVGKHAELSTEQFAFMDEFTSWYFDDWDWTLKKQIDTLEDNYDAYLEDKIYEYNLDHELMKKELGMEER